MSKIVNLRTARKQTALADKRRDADGAAAKHGRTKAERARDALEAEKLRAYLDNHRREP